MPSVTKVLLDKHKKIVAAKVVCCDGTCMGCAALKTDTRERLILRHSVSSYHDALEEASLECPSFGVDQLGAQIMAGKKTCPSFLPAKEHPLGVTREEALKLQEHQKKKQRT